MKLNQKIVTERKQKGFTQEQLADLSNVTVRTIQRIESGETTPRAFTLKAIANALGSDFEEWVIDTGIEGSINSKSATLVYNPDNNRHLLSLISLSCFSYLIIPIIHFLIPSYILKKSGDDNPKVIAFARAIIRMQLYWQAGLCLMLLATVAFNLTMVSYFQKSYIVNYLVPFFIMYFINAIIISVNLIRIKKIDAANEFSI